MALITCNKCGNRFSNLKSACPECGFDSKNLDLEQIKKTALREFRTRMYHLKMVSYVALTIITVGFIWYWNASLKFQVSPGWGPWILMGIGALGYLLISGLIILTKLRYRKVAKLKSG